jgi:hypothetical protein
VEVSVRLKVTVPPGEVDADANDRADWARATFQDAARKMPASIARLARTDFRIIKKLRSVECSSTRTHIPCT